MAKPKKSNRGANMQRQMKETVAEGTLLVRYCSEVSERSKALFAAITDAWPWIGGAAYCGFMEKGAKHDAGGALVIDNSAGDFGLPPRGAVPAVYLNYSDAIDASVGLYFDDNGPPWSEIVNICVNEAEWPEAVRFSKNMGMYEPFSQAVVAVRYGPGDCVHFLLEAFGSGDLFPLGLYNSLKSAFDNRHDKPTFWLAETPNSEHYSLTVTDEEYRAYQKYRGKGII